MEDEGQPRLSITILAVADTVRSALFYREAFGWKVRVEVPVYVELELPDGAGLGLYQREAFGRNTGQAPHPHPAGALSGAELYFRTVELEPAQRRLEAAGARLLSPLAPRDWGDEVVYYSDPDGHVVALARVLDGD